MKNIFLGLMIFMVGWFVLWIPIGDFTLEKFIPVAGGYFIMYFGNRIMEDN